MGNVCPELARIRLGSGLGEFRRRDDQIARLVRELDPPVWVVTSDRELRERVHDHAERIIGGGSFAKELAAD